MLMRGTAADRTPLRHATTATRALTQNLNDDNKARKVVIKGAEYVATASTIYASAMQLYNWWDHRRSFYVTVKADDAIYPEIQSWLFSQVPEVDQKAIVAQTTAWGRPASIHDLLDDDDDDIFGNGERDTPDEMKPKLARVFDDLADRDVEIEGHKITVSVRKPEPISEGGYVTSSLEPESMVFVAKSRAGQEAVLRKLDSFVTVRKASKRIPNLWLLNSSGGWTTRNDLPPRTLDTVVLRDGQLDRIVEDMQSFLDNEKEYARRGIPYHRGYLLQGPPGTGKTSIARALAYHFSSDVWYAPLGDLKADTSLLDLMSRVTARSIVLLEDVDIYAQTHDREGQTGAATLSGLLNAMDGVSTPHGVIFILTTNEPDVLDSALIRPGRIDLVETVGMPDDDQATEIFKYFYQQAPTEPIKAEDRSPAALIEIMKQHMFDPALGEKALRNG